MTLHYKTCGLGNIWLLSGYKTHETKYGTSFSYEDIDELYRTITIELCINDWKMSPEIIRFLRKRLGCSQKEFGREFGCTSQAVAKWEKGTSGIPLSVDRLVRLLCLEKFAPYLTLDEAIAIHRRPFSTRLELEYIDSKWTVVGSQQKVFAEETEGFFEEFENGSQFDDVYVDLIRRVQARNEEVPVIADKVSVETSFNYLPMLGSA